MKFTFNIEKKHLVILIIFIAVIGIGIVIASTYPSPDNPPSHDTLWTKEIKGKNVEIIQVYDNLNLVPGKISLNGINIWFKTDGPRTSLCYDAPSCALSENTCSKTQNIDFPLEDGTCNTIANNFYCYNYCTSSLACSGTEVAGCIGSTTVYYSNGQFVSCDDSRLTVTCKCSVGAKYYSEYLQSQTCIG